MGTPLDTVYSRFFSKVDQDFTGKESLVYNILISAISRSRKVVNHSLDFVLDELELEQEETFGSIEAVKTVADALMPVGGKVLEVNEKLEDEPELVNTDPYGEGWMIKIEMTDPSELDSLMDAETYKASL